MVGLWRAGAALRLRRAVVGRRGSLSATAEPPRATHAVGILYLRRPNPHSPRSCSQRGPGTSAVSCVGAVTSANGSGSAQSASSSELSSSRTRAALS